jgi:hypothetical protein
MKIGLANVSHAGKCQRKSDRMATSRGFPVSVTNLGKVTKCMNPDTDCPNQLDPVSAYVVVYKGKPLVLCKACGPEIQRKAKEDAGPKFIKDFEG